MEPVKRRITYRLYPTPAQEARLKQARRLHCELYNAALEERREAYRRQQRSISFYEQDRQLTQIRKDRPEMAPFGRKAFVGTLRRVQLAFEAFFRRAVAGQRPGYPRFKSIRRFGGWDYPAAADGWSLAPGEGGRHGRLRLMGIGHVALRGKVRQLGQPRTCTISLRSGRWYASIVVECQPQRARGSKAIGFDWGVSSFLTFHTGDEVEAPEFAHKAQGKLRHLQKQVSRKKRGSQRRQKATRRLAREKERVANRRRNFLHQTTAALVGKARLVATERLQIRNMTRSARGTMEEPGRNVRQKAGLNRKILDGAPGAFLQMLHYKAEEAGVQLVEVDTPRVKPSQTCPKCWRQEKKRLSDRMHVCTCGLLMPRDQASALVCLKVALGVGNRPSVEGRVGASLKRETPSKQLSLFGWG